MPIQLVWSNDEVQDSDDLVNLIAAHRRAVITIERFSKRLMVHDGEDTALITRQLDDAEEIEVIACQRLADAAVTSTKHAKMKAAHFRRLIGKGRCELSFHDLVGLLRSFEQMPD